MIFLKIVNMICTKISILFSFLCLIVITFNLIGQYRFLKYGHENIDVINIISKKLKIIGIIDMVQVYLILRLLIN